MLQDKNKHYAESGKTLTVTPANYKEDHPYLREVDALVLCNEQMHLSRVRNFFACRAGYPRFRSKHRDRKFYTINLVSNNIRVTDRSIRLPKVGEVKARIQRKPPEGWKLKSVTVSKDRDRKYHAFFLFEYDTPAPPLALDPLIRTNAIGLDYKTACLYADSEGGMADMPKLP